MASSIIIDISWYVHPSLSHDLQLNQYHQTTAGTQLLFGKFYTYFPIKWVYVISIAIFECGSFICGAAPSSIIFIIGRAIAGIGNAGIFAGTFHYLVHTGAHVSLFAGALVIVANTVPLEKRPLYTGMIGGHGWNRQVITDKLSFRLIPR
jgi:MFS family permease